MNLIVFVKISWIFAILPIKSPNFIKNDYSTIQRDFWASKVKNNNRKMWTQRPNSFYMRSSIYFSDKRYFHISQTCKMTQEPPLSPQGWIVRIHQNLNFDLGSPYTLKEVTYLDMKTHKTNTFVKCKKTYALAHEGHLRILKVTMTNNHFADI